MGSEAILRNKGKGQALVKKKIFSLKIIYLLNGTVTGKEGLREMEMEMFHLLIHSTKTYKSQDSPRLKSGVAFGSPTLVM